MPLLQRIASQAKFDITQARKQSSDASRVELEQALAAIAIAEAIPNVVGAWFEELLFVASSYTIEGYVREIIGDAQLRSLLRELGRLDLSFEKTFQIFLRMTAPGFFGWHIFHRHPDTKRTFSPDDEQKYVWLYCLQGLKAITNTDPLAAKPLSADIQSRLPDIQRVCNQLLATANRWTSILEIAEDEIRSRVGSFLDFNNQVIVRWQEERENQISYADLDPAKTVAFTQSVRDTLERIRGLRYLIQRCNRVQERESLPGKSSLGVYERQNLKEFFSSFYNSLHFVQELGAQYGAKLVRAENIHIGSAWSKKGLWVSTRKDWATLEPYLERALERFGETNHQATLIVVPQRIDYKMLYLTPNFVVQHATTDTDLSDQIGFYKGIPVVMSWNTLGPSRIPPTILVVDVEKAIQLVLEKPIIDVRTVEESDYDEIMRREPGITEKSLRLSVYIKVIRRAKLTITDRSAILKLRLKLPLLGQQT